MSIKSERISDALIKEISYILNYDVKNKDIKFVTITDVKVTNDLSFAKVYFTVLDSSRIKETLNALTSASGFIRHELRDRVDIRQIPELEFIYDESIEYGERIESILEQIKKDEK